MRLKPSIWRIERLTKRDNASLNSETCSSVRESACRKTIPLAYMFVSRIHRSGGNHGSTAGSSSFLTSRALDHRTMVRLEQWRGIWEFISLDEGVSALAVGFAGGEGMNYRGCWQLAKWETMLIVMTLVWVRWPSAPTCAESHCWQLIIGNLHIFASHKSSQSALQHNGQDGCDSYAIMNAIRQYSWTRYLSLSIKFPRLIWLEFSSCLQIDAILTLSRHDSPTMISNPYYSLLMLKSGAGSREGMEAPCCSSMLRLSTTFFKPSFQHVRSHSLASLSSYQIHTYQALLSRQLDPPLQQTSRLRLSI